MTIYGNKGTILRNKLIGMGLDPQYYRQDIGPGYAKVNHELPHEFGKFVKRDRIERLAMYRGSDEPIDSLNDEVLVGVGSISGYFAIIDAKPGYLELYQNLEMQVDKLKIWFNKKGELHREDGPACVIEEQDVATWYWEGRLGLENFPDDAIARLGDQVI